MSARVSSCLRFVACFCTTRVLLSVIGLSSSDISRIRLYLDRIVAIGGFSGLLVITKGMICFFMLVKSWDINKSSWFIVLAFVTALLMSFIGYPLRVKFLIRVCDALSNKLSVLHCFGFSVPSTKPAQGIRWRSVWRRPN